MESRLKKYISSLTEEERTLYKPLIEDALRRDEALSMTVAEAKANAAMLDYQMDRFRETTRQFHAGILKLNRKLSDLSACSGKVVRMHSGGAGGDWGCSKYKH